MCERSRPASTDHPHVALSLNNLAGLYYVQGRYAEAEPLYLRALSILPNVLGENHSNTQTCQENFRIFLSEVIQAGQRLQLSQHPMTQELLRQLQEELRSDEPDVRQSP